MFARANLVTAFPFGVKRVSGSLPKLPSKITLLIMVYLLFLCLVVVSFFTLDFVWKEEIPPGLP